MKRLFLLFLVLLVGCASLPLIESQDLGNADSRAKYMYDVKSNIAYKVQHDDAYVYLELKTDDQLAIQKILRNGLYIYLDPKAGKSKDIYFNYPLKGKPRHSETKQRMQNMSGERKFDVEKMLDNLDVEAIFSNNEIAEMIPIYAKSNSFKVELSAPTSTILVYKLQIPIDEILKNKREEQELSIGIMTAEFEMPSREESGDRPGGGPQGAGMSSSGMQSGGSGMYGGNGPSSGEMSTMKEQISIWFKIAL